MTMTYEAMKTEYTRLDVELTKLTRKIDASSPGSAEWRSLRKEYKPLSLRKDAILFTLLSDPATRFGNWRTPADIEAAIYVGWAGLRGNSAMALREAGVTAEQVLAN